LGAVVDPRGRLDHSIVDWNTGVRVEIRIRIINTGRELSFETASSADEVRAQVSSALEQNTSHLSFADVKGNSYLVPTANLAYIELGTEESRRVGFFA